MITSLREEFSKKMSVKDEAPAAEDQHSHDSASTDEGGAAGV